MMDLDETILTMDEFESIRLKDYEGMNQKQAAEKMGISQPPEEFFDGISTVSKVKRQKPFPDVYILATQMAEVEPRHCIALEDSESGVRSARAAGIMRVLAVPHEYTQTQDFTQAFAVLKNLREAMRFFT